MPKKKNKKKKLSVKEQTRRNLQKIKSSGIKFAKDENGDTLAFIKRKNGYEMVNLGE